MTEEGRRLGVVVSGSLSGGLEARLDEGVGVEEVLVGRYVTIDGEQRRFFGLVSDVRLDALDRGLLVSPPGENAFLSQVLRGTGTFGVIKVLPSLVLSGDAATLLEGPQPVKTVPAHFSAVREASPRDVELVFGAEDERHFYVGNPLDMEAKVCLDLEELVLRSNGVFGKTGTGKTFLTRLLLIGILQKNTCGLLVFDMHSEYGWEGGGERKKTVKALKQLFPSRVAIFTLDPDDARQRRVPVDFAVQVGYEEIEPEDIELLGETLALTELALNAAHRLRRHYGKGWLQRFLELSPEETAELAESLGEHEGTLAALRRRLEALRRLPFLVPGTPAESPVRRLLDYIARGMSVVLEFGRYRSELAYLLVANLLTRRLYERYQEPAGEVEHRPLVIVIEEAHKFLSPRLAGQTIFGTIAREMRKFNVTLLVVDQRPSGIDPEVMSQLGTRLICLLDDEKDVDAALSGTPARSELKAVLSRLENRRQALFLGHALPMPVVVEVREYGTPQSYRELGYLEPAERRRRAEKDIEELF